MHQLYGSKLKRFIQNRHQKYHLPLFIYLIFIQTDCMSASSEKKWVEGMFEQVSVNLHQLLDSLTYIYESHGVEYAIKHYFGTLMRLLAPIQLLVNNTQDSIEQKTNYPMQEYKKQKKSKKKHQENQSSSQISQKQIHKSKKNIISLKDHYKRDRSKYEDNFQEQYKSISKPNHFNQQLQQQESQKDSDNQVITTLEKPKIRQSHRYGSSYSKTSISQQQQLVLCEWINKQISKGTLITKHKIMDRARKMSKNKQFQASSGWCRRFLFRNQDIRVAIEMNKFHPDIKRRKDQSNLEDQPHHSYKYWNQYNKQNDSFEQVKSQYDLFQQPEENEYEVVQKGMNEISRNKQELLITANRFEDKVKNHKQNMMNRNSKK